MKKKVVKILMTGLLSCAVLVGSMSVVYASHVEHLNQDVTAYLGDSGAYGAGGWQVSEGDVAVHPSYYTTHPDHSNWDNPIIPFGTIIVLKDGRITMPSGSELAAFVVADTGQLHNEDSLSTYWFDIYAGTNTDSNAVNWANNFGKQIHSYYILH
jgi:hypothetical protein